jgi:hypothetical protein
MSQEDRFAFFLPLEGSRLRALVPTSVKTELLMYLRKMVQMFLFVMLMVAGVSLAPSQASARNHYHHRHAHLRHVVSSHSGYFCHFGCRSGTRLTHFGHHARTHTAYLVHRHREPVSSAVGIGGPPGQLQAKAHEIVSNCGSTIISGFRPGARIAGSGHASMHASGRAVDIKGNPHCIYSHLQGWPGGYSVDYGAVQHVHISLGGFEDGVRFSHHGSHHRSS